MTEEEKFLTNAADLLRTSLETFRASHFKSLLGINNSYLLNISLYVQKQSFQNLETLPVVTAKELKEALFKSCMDFCIQERKAAPLSYETKHEAFMHDMCALLNIPNIEYQLVKDHPDDPVMHFAHAFWKDYTAGWQKFKLKNYSNNK